MAKCSQCGRTMPALSLRKKCDWCLQYEAAKRGEEIDYRPVVNGASVHAATEETPVTYALLAINILIYVMMVATGVNPTSPSGEAMVKWGANFGPYTLGGEWWRLVAHMFLHFGIMHLAFNMWFLYALGIACEELLGSVTYALMYLISGIAGGVAALAWHPFAISAGASGALFGILGAMIGAYKFGEFSMPRELVRMHLNSMIWCAVLNLAIGFSGVFGSIDNAAHIGGLIAGFVIGAAVAKAAPHPRNFVRRSAILFLVAASVGGGLALVRWRLTTPRAIARNQPLFLTLFQQGKTDQVIAETKKVLAKEPNNSLARMVLAASLAKKNDAAGAMEQYMYLVDHNPAGEATRTAAEFGLRDLFLRGQDFDAAEKYFANILAKDPNDAAAHFCVADLAVAQKRYDAAIAEFKTVQNLQPNAPLAYIGLARTYSSMKKYDDSIAAYKRAIELTDQGGKEQLGTELAQVEAAKQGTATAK